MLKTKKISFLVASLVGVFFLVSAKTLAQGFDLQELGTFGLPGGEISSIVENIVTWLLGIFGFLGIIAFVISGIFYLTAAGDAKQEEKAKLAMKMGITGIVVGLVGFVAIKAIDALLRGNSGF